MTIGQLTYNYRTQHGLSMEAFGKLCGCSKQYISFLEKNQNPGTGKPINISMDKTRAIASAMNMDLDELLAELDPDTVIKLKPKTHQLTYKERQLLDAYNSLNDSDRGIIDNMLEYMTKKAAPANTEAE